MDELHTYTVLIRSTAENETELVLEGLTPQDVLDYAPLAMDKFGRDIFSSLEIQHAVLMIRATDGSGAEWSYDRDRGLIPLNQAAEEHLPTPTDQLGL